MPLEPKTVRLSCPCSELYKETRKSIGMSLKEGILYVEGPFVNKLPSAFHTISSRQNRPTPWLQSVTNFESNHNLHQRINLHECPFYLTDVNSRVEGFSNIMSHIRPQNVHVAGQNINFDFRHSCSK
jgi:hypothetical protein